MSYVSIGQLSKQTNCKIPTIRFYEQEGLLQPANRTEGNQRRYQETHVKRLRFILHARELGFALPDIRELISLSEEGSHSHEADQIVVRQLEGVERKIARLILLKKELSNMVGSCENNLNNSCNIIACVVRPLTVFR